MIMSTNVHNFPPQFQLDETADTKLKFAMVGQRFSAYSDATGLTKRTNALKRTSAKSQQSNRNWVAIAEVPQYALQEASGSAAYHVSSRLACTSSTTEPSECPNGTDKEQIKIEGRI
jgi:hypothetical protein